MKPKNIIVAMLTLAMLSACSRNNNGNPGEIPGEFESNGVISHAMKGKSAYTKADLNTLLDGYLRKKLGRQATLTAIRKMVSKAELTNINASAETQALTIDDIVRSMAKIDGASLVEMILNAKVSDQVSAIPNRRQVQELFATLLKPENKQLYSQEIQFDQLLIRYLSLRVIDYKSSITSEMDESTFKEANDFFQARIALRKSQIPADNESARSFKTAVLNTYSELAISFPNSPWLDDALAPFLIDINTASLNAHGLLFRQELYRRQMSRGNDLKITEQQLSDLFATADSLSKSLERRGKVAGSDIQWFDLMNFYMDRLALTVETTSAAIEMLDKRIEANNHLAVSLAKLTKNSEDMMGLNFLSHPVLDAALTPVIKLLVDSSNLSVSATAKNKLNLEKSFSSKVEIAHGILQQFFELPLHNKYAFSLNNDLSIKEKNRIYLQGLTLVILGRDYLSRKTNLNLSESVNDYKALRKVLQLALCVRFEEKLKKIDPNQACEYLGNADGIVMMNPSIAARTLQEFDPEAKLIGGDLNLDWSGEKIVPPGIYTADNNVSITAEKIVFHPLAMIYTNGKNLTLKAKTVENFWIDSSGVDQTNSALAPPIDGVAASADGSFLGHQPSTPNPADSGRSGGDIVVNGDAVSGLVAAFGGNGEHGFAGAESPQCSNSIYHAVTRTYQVHVGRHPKDCEACYIRVCAPWPFSGCAVQDNCGNDGNRGQMCGWVDEFGTRTDTYNVFAGSGGNGGAAGNGGNINIHFREGGFVSAINISGTSGIKGTQGICGPPDNTVVEGSLPPVNGVDGAAGTNGLLTIENGN